MSARIRANSSISISRSSAGLVPWVIGSQADKPVWSIVTSACTKLGLKHIRTKPYTPKTNGKAERFIQTSLREWAYARSYDSSDQRTAELARWLHSYNWHRPHGSIGSKPPISRLALDRNNLLRLQS